MEKMTHLVMFKRNFNTKRLQPFHVAGKHIVWFQWIMESMFRMRQLDFESAEFRINIV